MRLFRQQDVEDSVREAIRRLKEQLLWARVYGPLIVASVFSGATFLAATIILARGAGREQIRDEHSVTPDARVFDRIVIAVRDRVWTPSGRADMLVVRRGRAVRIHVTPLPTQIAVRLQRTGGEARIVSVPQHAMTSEGMYILNFNGDTALSFRASRACRVTVEILETNPRALSHDISARGGTIEDIVVH